MKFQVYKVRASEEFKHYTGSYDTSNVGVILKISHSYRVAGIAERIAKSVQAANFDFAWLLGLLHDIGRFEQITKYGTFKDALSVDHAELGADILFNGGLFGKFVPESSPEIETIAQTAIRLHNKLRIPENLEKETEMYTKILRDADKVDIFRVLTEPPYDEIYTRQNLKGLTVRDEIMQCVKEHRCVPRPASAEKANALETLIGQCCMAFELEYPESRAIAAEQGYLRKLLDKDKDSEKLAIVKTEAANYLKI